MPTIQGSRASGRIPDGVVAAALALAIAGTAGQAMQAYARYVAGRHLALVTTGDVPFKQQTLAFQRAALASGHVLPIYGSSELFCCGRTFRPTAVFASRPTGFDVLALGSGGTGDLFFAETFAALGHDARDKRVVVSDSPTWFSNRRGLTREQYGSSFLPEAAYAFVFDAPLSLPLREMGARRMLAYPETLRDPLLRRAVEDLAHPTRINLADYAALGPLGRLATWALEVRDAARTAVFVWNPARRPEPPPPSAPLDWATMATRGTRIAEAASTTNPFGFSDAAYSELRRRRKFRDALALYDSGRTNRDGSVLPPGARERTAWRSTEWTDLRLALRVLREVGARPLVWTLPLPGAFYDYTTASAPVRRTYYERYARTAEQAGVPWLDFRAHDEDRLFVNDPGSHLSARGWVFADRAVDRFWHAGSIADIRAALATLARAVPAPGPTPELAEAAGPQPSD
jgi:D-alanine transfer protein